MRVHEILHRHIDGVTRVVDASEGVTDLQGLLFVPDGVEYLSGEAATTAVAAGLEPGDVLVLAITDPDPGHWSVAAERIARTAPGGRVLVVTTGAAADTPVGAVAAAAGEASCHVTEAVVVAQGRWAVTMMMRRVQADGALYPVRAAADGRELPGPSAAMVLRIANEWALSALVQRTKTQELEQELVAARADIERLKAELESSQTLVRAERARAQKIEASKEMALGKAVVDVRRDPVRGSLALPAALRRARGPR